MHRGDAYVWCNSLSDDALFLMSCRDCIAHVQHSHAYQTILLMGALRRR